MASFLPASCLNVAVVMGVSHELAELVGAGVFVAQDRQLVLDERVIDKRHTGRVVGDGHGLIAPFVAAAKRPS